MIGVFIDKPAAGFDAAPQWQAGDERPAFEVRDPVSGHVYKIWADGQIEGFGSAGLVVNRIPQIVAQALDANEDFRTE